MCNLWRRIVNLKRCSTYKSSVEKDYQKKKKNSQVCTSKEYNKFPWTSHARCFLWTDGWYFEWKREVSNSYEIGKKCTIAFWHDSNNKKKKKLEVGLARKEKQLTIKTQNKNESDVSNYDLERQQTCTAKIRTWTMYEKWKN